MSSVNSRERTLRPLDETQISPSYEPSTEEDKSSVESALFPNDEDQKQFVKIYQAIEQTDLINSEQTEPEIIKIMAEYSTGSTKECDNESCPNLICIFSEDLLFDDDWFDEQIGAYKLEAVGRETYIYNQYNQYFCSECMNDVKPTGKMAHAEKNILNCYLILQYIPDCDVCEICHNVIPKLCLCEPPNAKACSKCDNKVCIGCVDECSKCQKQFCSKCTENNGKEHNRRIHGTKFVCNHCYVDGVVECTDCSQKFNLLYDGNEILNAAPNHQMHLCMHEECDNYVHYTLAVASVCPFEVETNLMICGMNGCENKDYCYEAIYLCKHHKVDSLIDFRCREHGGEQTVDLNQYLFKKQKEMTYEEALNLFLHNDEYEQIIQVYDSKVRKWRPARYFYHFDKTKKIQIQYAYDCLDRDRYCTLAFPCNYIRVQSLSME